MTHSTHNTLKVSFIKSAIIALSLCLFSVTSWSADINYNTANMETLQSIPGIGESKAKSIINYRNKIGGFSSTEQLIEVSGIGEKMLETMKEHGKVVNDTSNTAQSSTGS